ncbi:MAG: ferrous iron transport protein A [Firmicutes bacterium]|jgi:ferrous iron transport protein A|nr:ferrous iron transport protein A [Bacillota bacterium]
MTLNQLPAGKLGVVLCITAEGPIRRRMLDLGLVPGTIVKTLRSSPAGNPTAYLIRGSVIAFRSNTANQVLIRTIHRR